MTLPRTPRAFLLLVLASTLLAAMGCDKIPMLGDPPITLTVHFEEPNALAVGNKALQGGAEVGEITAVRPENGVEVDVELATGTAATVKTSSFARVVESGAQGTHLEIITLDEKSAPVKGGERLEGADGKLDEVAIRTKYMANASIEAAAEGLEKASKAIETHGNATLGAAVEAAAKGLDKAKEVIEANEETIKAAAEAARLGVTATQKALENAGKQLQEDLQNR